MKSFRETFYVEGTGGSLDPFPIAVGAPKAIAGGEYACRVFCPSLGRPAQIRSSDPRHAYYLAFRFAKDVTEDVALVDRSGRAMELVCPPWPPSTGPHAGGARRVPPAGLRSEGTKPFRKIYVARRADGSRGRFQVYVGRPRRVRGGHYKCRVSCPALKMPIHARAATPTEARFLAFRALRRIVDISDLVLEDRKGHSVDLPRPPRLPYFENERRFSGFAPARPKTRGAPLKTFRKTYLVKGADGGLGRFEVFVGKPEKISELEYKSRVFCPLLRTPAHVRFIDPERAYDLAFRVVEDLLRHADLQLVDREENPIELSRAAKPSRRRPT